MKNVKILGVNGSPRLYGNTTKLLLVALKVAELEGASVEVINLYDYRIEHCIGCVADDQKYCKYPCVIEDDMRILYDKVLEADGLIIATPVYWYSPSSMVKTFIDRLTALENMVFHDGRSWVEGKVCGVIAVGNDSGSIHVIATLYSILNSMGFLIPPWALAYFDGNGDVLDDEGSVLDAANLGRSIYLACREVKRKRWYKRYDIRKDLKDVINYVKAIVESNRKVQARTRIKSMEVVKLLK